MQNGKKFLMSELSRHSQDEAPLVIGDFYEGVYGPTIILILMSRAAGAWFQAILRELASGGPPKRLTSDPNVHVAHLGEIEMTTRTSDPQVAVKRRDADGKASFVWSATRQGWQYLADLTQPLCTSGAGHHYLTDDNDDDCLIELSFGEQGVLDSVRSAQDDGS